MVDTISVFGISEQISPKLVTGLTDSRTAQTIVHPIIGRADPEVVIAPPLLRSGTLDLLIESEAEASAAVARLSGMHRFYFYSSDRPSLSMSFVVTGTIDRTLDEATRDLWVVSFGYQEVPT